MSRFTAIDLSQLPAPTVVETLDYEQILGDMVADLQQRDAAFSALVESDPAYKILEVAAYREMLLRQRVNDASRAVMLAYAGASDLDNLAALFGVQRQVLDPGNPDAVPPIPPTYEDDTRLRRRVQLSLEGHSTAGPVGSYIFHALSASSQVKDVTVISPGPGEIEITVLSTEGNGTADQALLNQVDSVLNAENVRPLSDHPTVQVAQIVEYNVDAVLTLYSGPDAELVRQTAEQAVNAFVAEQHVLGRDITLSGLHAALHQAGVHNVQLTSPAASIVIAPHQAAWCIGVTVTTGGIDE